MKGIKWEIKKDNDKGKHVTIKSLFQKNPFHYKKLNWLVIVFFFQKELS